MKKYWLVLLLLSGCSSDGNKRPTDLDGSLKRTNELASLSGKVEDVHTKESLGIYLNKRAIKTKENIRLPANFRKNFVYRRLDVLPLSEILKEVTLLTGMRITLSTDVYTNGELNPVSNVDSSISLDSAGSTSSSSPSTGDTSASDSPTEIYIQPDYNGSLEGFFNWAAAKTNLFWKYEHGRVLFYRYDTRSWPIVALAGNAVQTSNISTGGGGGDAGSSSATLNTSVSADTSIYVSLQNDISNMLSPAGKFSVSEVFGTVTVTDSPYVLDRVDTFISSINSELDKQILVKLELYEVNLTDESEHGIDWKAVYNAAGSYGLDFTTSSLPSSSPANLTYTLTDPTSPFTGSQLFVRALKEIGEVSRLQYVDITTQNGQPAQAKLINEETYLASVSTVTTTGVGSEQSVVPGVTTGGLTLNLLTRAVNNKVLIRYAFDLATIKDIETISSGSSSIQTPKRSIKNIVQNVQVRNGNTLVIAGYQDMDNGDSFSGITNMLPFLGGLTKKRSNKSIMIILMTPYVVET